jgi:phage-related protein
MMKLTIRPILHGPAFRIYGLVFDGSCETEDFLAQAEHDDPDEFASMVALLDRTTKHGPPKNKEKSREVGDGIYEFKSKSLRICYFYDSGKMIICTHGFGKPAKKVQDREIHRARALKQTYFNLKVKSEILIEKSAP